MKGNTVRRRVMGTPPPTIQPPPPGWGHWTSPNGVTHLITGTGACATCGRAHPDPEVAWSD